MDWVWSQKDSVCAIRCCCFSSAGQQKASPSLALKKALFPRPRGRAVLSLPMRPTTCSRQRPPPVSGPWDGHPIHPTSLTLTPQPAAGGSHSPPCVFFQKMRFGSERSVFLEGHPFSPAFLVWSRICTRCRAPLPPLCPAALPHSRSGCGWEGPAGSPFGVLGGRLRGLGQCFLL